MIKIVNNPAPKKEQANVPLTRKQFTPEFKRIMTAEYHLACPGQPLSWGINRYFHHDDHFYGLVTRILEVAKSSFVTRSYNSRYALDPANSVYESVGAHANLVSAIVDAALPYVFTDEWTEDGIITRDGYTYREIMEAVRLHDLPENITGDIPDNGERDEQEKDLFEQKYFCQYLSCHYDQVFREHVFEILAHMHDPYASTGSMVYLADKAAALVITLCTEIVPVGIDIPLICTSGHYHLSPRDLAEINYCDYNVDGWCKASEMWTVNFFKISQHVTLDKSHFFTALIVATTLICCHQWYSWRERDYQ